MKCMYFRVGCEPDLVEIKPCIDEITRIMDGEIEYIYLFDDLFIILKSEADPVFFPPNRVMFHFEDRYEIIKGDFLIVKIDKEESFVSLDEQDIDNIMNLYLPNVS